MEIIEKTDRVLHITDKNRQCLWGLLLVTPFFLIGLKLLGLTASIITLECQRSASSQIECQLSVTGISGTKKEQIPGFVTSAKTVKTSGKGVVFTTTKGEIELAPYRAFVTDRTDKTVDRLNAFIKNPQQPTISIEQDDRWANSLFIVNFLAAGMAVVFGALAIPLRMSCRLDRNSGEAIVDKKYLLYGDRQTKIPLATIDRSLVKKLPFHVNSKSVYNIHLIPSVGKKVSLSVPSSDLSHYQEIVDLIKDFLSRY
ncbi:hypothetical protein [Chamaesiphon polymorphus]|uniref:Uncharacterized protein n=1 Tax=Chamaesiphon polymorphus CCALA 037 TaxID=2107692 RepID=A0A2T1GDK5_9CYAN|nr:hypothetical protein [Chamaesiphon polymorphus]PSB55570.1 hypothetical protein C7B77_14550 [Chamaesiphon polymorphus CCALA 037]